ncbi:MAG: HAD family hydrolase [Hamadaea sp.]|nr:HAD family hydrolase [Hamadaea sp.]
MINTQERGAPVTKLAAAARTGGSTLSGVKHLVWDWNGTLLNDLGLVVAATNVAITSVGGQAVSEEEHRRDFRRPIIDYYGSLLGRPVEQEEFAALDEIFHVEYRTGLLTVDLAADARDAIASWAGTQSLLSMWFHHELVPTVDRFGLTPHFARVDGLRAITGGGFKAGHLAAHLEALGVDGADTVLIGDSLDDAHAAASVGARCVLYSGGFTAAAKLSEAGVPVADTLVGAIALANS